MAMLKEHNRIVKAVKIESVVFTDEENKTWEDFGKLLNKLANLECEYENLTESFEDMLEYYNEINREITSS